MGGVGGGESYTFPELTGLSLSYRASGRCAEVGGCVAKTALHLGEPLAGMS